MEKEKYETLIINPEPIRLHRENCKSNLAQLSEETRKLPPLKLPRRMQQLTKQKKAAPQATSQKYTITFPPIHQR